MTHMSEERRRGRRTVQRPQLLSQQHLTHNREEPYEVFGHSYPQKY